MNRLALFDCDGTLVDGQADHCNAMEAAFIAAGKAPLPREVTRRVIGLSLLESMRILLPDENEETHYFMVAEYKQSFSAMRGRGQISEPLYDGIKPLLSHLNGAGWMLGVATGKSDRGLVNCLTEHGIKDEFISLQTADRHPSKPHPSMIFQAMDDAGAAPETTVMIGDTSFDMHMGRAAGCRNIGVNWGYHSIEELRDAGADHIVKNMDELRALLGDLA